MIVSAIWSELHVRVRMYVCTVCTRIQYCLLSYAFKACGFFYCYIAVFTD